MIEAIVAYIQDKGFEVHVFPRVLAIRKEANERLWGMDWAIAREEFNLVPKEVLFSDVDRCMYQIDAAIAADHRERR